MALDSEATFRERVVDRGLGAHLTHFESLGWRTLSDLVYATNYSPQGSDAASEQMFTDDNITKGLGSATHIDRPRLRRLFFEASPSPLLTFGVKSNKRPIILCG